MAFSDNLRNMLDAFGIAGNRLARYLDYDPSYISRILAGQRTPADRDWFIDGVSAYIARNYCNDAGVQVLAAMTGEPAESLREQAAFTRAIRAVLVSEDSAKPEADALGDFLDRLDEFDLQEFMRDIRFDEIKVPTAPFQLPISKVYSGIDQMKQAELDFLKAAVLARSTEDIILYSDMPLQEMAADEAFAKQVMMGMAMLIRKGAHLRAIHDVHRPLNELFMGLEGWIPVYMTGQIASYYLPQPTNSVFLHFLRSAGTVAITGEAVAGNQGGGRYVVTKNPADVAYLRRRAGELLVHAKPLMRIYRGDRSDELARVLGKHDAKAEFEPVQVGDGTFKNMRITVRKGCYALIQKNNEPKVSFLIEYPELVNAFESYEPTLFNG